MGSSSITSSHASGSSFRLVTSSVNVIRGRDLSLADRKEVGETNSKSTGDGVEILKGRVTFGALNCRKVSGMDLGPVRKSKLF